MIAVFRSELYRSLSLRSSWLALAGFAVVAALSGWLDRVAWSLFAGGGAFGLAVILVAQHHQHRTAILLYLARPRRWPVLVAQCLVAALLGSVLVAVSGIALFLDGQSAHYLSTLRVAPLIAVLGVLCATVVRRPLWLVAGAFGWVLFIEGLINRMDHGLPFASYMFAAGGDPAGLLHLLAWTAAVVPPALWSLHRDLTAD